MDLASLAERVPGARLVGDGAIAIARVASDSREIEVGDLFVAVRGLRSDGHDFVDQAIAQGAAAVALEAVRAELDVPQLIVGSGAAALGELTAAVAGDPARAMRLVGITGTNGKTTTTYLVESILSAAGAEPGVIGTVSYRFRGASYPAPYTTPTPLILHRIFADMARADHGRACDHAVLEVSSIALAMERLAGVRFAVAAFNNLSQDHLDIHGDMDSYRDAKARLFSDHLADDGIAVVNIDDPAAGTMIAAAGDRRILRVSAAGREQADVRAVDSSSTIDGVRVRLATPRGTVEVSSSSLLGRYNVDNLALAVAIAEALGIGHGDIAAGVAAMAGVPGRVERVYNDRDLDILVDYAHTPDALANVLDALKPLASGRLICVFGCGGDRDPGKRPLMGEEAAARADLVVVTSDNPRTEDPASIIEMILPGVPEPFFVDSDRGTAIAAAVAEATPGDIVLIAGKGHEDYQILGTSKIHFDDREEAAAAASSRRRFDLDELAGAAGGTISGGSAPVSRVVIDGRIAAPGDLYVAIRGERFDGHDFADQAVAAGAVAVVVERGHSALDSSVPRIEVEDTRTALGMLGRHRRRCWGKTLIAITGSAGKTTTKELTAAALRGRHPHRTRGSLNNETGVPLTLLGLHGFHEVAVVEMGMRGLGQIDYLCELAEPDIGVVVNAGTAHVGVVGDAADIVRGKSEIFARLPAGGIAIYPADDPRIEPFARAAPSSISFGAVDSADVRLVEYRALGARGSALRIACVGAVIETELALVGRHNAINACCALAAAIAAGESADAAAAGLASARPPALRGQRLELGDRRVFVDCYNSNPAALEAALATLAEMATADGSRAVAVIGDMLELGDDAARAHREAGRRAAERNIAVIAIGELAGEVAAGAGESAAVAATVAEAAEIAWKRAGSGGWILLKASRGAKLERVLQAMRESEEVRQARP